MQNDGDVPFCVSESETQDGACRMMKLCLSVCMSQSETQDGACRMTGLCLSLCLSQSETQQGACRMMRLCLSVCPKANLKKEHADGWSCAFLHFLERNSDRVAAGLPIGKRLQT